MTMATRKTPEELASVQAHRRAMSLPTLRQRNEARTDLAIQVAIRTGKYLMKNYNPNVRVKQ